MLPPPESRKDGDREGAGGCRHQAGDIPAHGLLATAWFQSVLPAILCFQRDSSPDERPAKKMAIHGSGGKAMLPAVANRRVKSPFRVGTATEVSGGG